MPKIDLNREYGIVLEGGGAKGAYQVGAWKALREAGVKIRAVAGTSVGALNGALICMDDIDRAEKLWKNIRYSSIMDGVDDDAMQALFEGRLPISEILKIGRDILKDRGIEIEPLRALLKENVDTQKIRESRIDFYVRTVSVTDRKALEIHMNEADEEDMVNYLLASSYISPIFKSEKIEGKRYLDGGFVDNVPVGTLLQKGIKNIIVIRIYGIGIERPVSIPENANIITIAPEEDLGNIMDFSAVRCQENMERGYQDALRVLREGDKTPERPDSLIERFVQQAGEKIADLGIQEKWKLRSGKNKMTDLKGRNFLTLKDFTPEEISSLLELSADLKEKKKKGIPVDVHRGKNVALIFEKTSTRTRCSFEVAAHDLGMGTTYLDPKSSQIGKKESIEDTARVLGSMFEGIEYRGYGQEIVEELARYAGVPVWNGLTNEYHPTQMLADMLTIQENFGKLKGIKLVYLGDARYNMGNSYMIACAKMGMDFVACAPKKYFPVQELVEECQKYAEESGATITLTEDVMEGTKGADVICTDVWVSMGEPDEVWEERIRDLTPYKVTKEVMDNGSENVIFLHCLPSFHDLNTGIGKEMGERFGLTEMEVTDEVFRSGRSKVFQEAENRMHTIKAVMLATLGE